MPTNHKQLRAARNRKKVLASAKPPKAREPSVNKDQFLSALKDSGGIHSTIAERLGINRSTVYRLLNRPDWQDDVKLAFYDECERTSDLAEQTIKDLISQRDNLGEAGLNSRWWLTRRRPETYGDQSTLNVNATVPHYFKFQVPRGMIDLVKTDPRIAREIMNRVKECKDQAEVDALMKEAMTPEFWSKILPAPTPTPMVNGSIVKG